VRIVVYREQIFKHNHLAGAGVKPEFPHAKGGSEAEARSIVHLCYAAPLW
jgi:hypothetical protein